MNEKKLFNTLQSLSLGAFLAFSSITGAEEPELKQIVVDDNKVECPSAQFSSIQEAVDAAAAGTEIRVCAGSYSEQVTITKSIKLIGERGSIVIPKDMKVNATNLAMYEDMFAVFSVKGATDILIQGLTIDGKNSGMSNCSAEFAGIVCEDMSGEIKEVTIRNLYSKNGSPESCHNGYGIFAQSSDSGEMNLKVNDSRFDDCHRGAIVGNNMGTVVRAQGNTIGTISTCETESNALKLAFGAIGTSKSNTVATIE